MTYASDTSVPADRSRAEIEKTLARYGASQFMYGWDDDRAVILFRMSEDQGFRQVRFVLQLPPREQFALTPGGRRRRSSAQIEQAFEQAVRSKWRARPGHRQGVSSLARPPKTSAAIVAELSATCRAVLHGRAGSLILIRGEEVFVLNDLEAAKLDAARHDYLRRLETATE